MENKTAYIPADAANKVELRWYQYRLRSLLIFVTVFAIACSWLTVKKQQATRQKDAIEALRKLGYGVEYDYEHYLSTFNKPPAPEWIINLFGKDFLYDGYGVKIDYSLRGVYPDLEIHPPRITDANMILFNSLPKLRTLDLHDTWGYLPGVKYQLTDKGLEQLKTMKNLEFLDLSGTQITDAGLEKLKGLTSLKELFIGDTKVTDVGINDLQKRLPNLRIRR